MDRRQAIAALLSGPLVAAHTLRAQSRDLTSLTIAEAGQRLAARDISPLQLTNAYLDRIASLNTTLNAFVTITDDLARREARALPDPRRTLPSRLYGIPIAHKDLFETKGVRTTAGSLLFEDYIPGDNAAIVEQLETAGAVLLGKTNTHELGGGVTTINPFFGTTRNPVDHTRIPGGSSGGSAAAVVARLCAAATGSDTGGSVRIPAAMCGCVGFKPTHGRISTQGLIAASPSFDHVGFLTRTVEDAEIMLHAIPTRFTLPTSNNFPTSIRVGIARSVFFEDLEPAVATAVDAAIAQFKARGATLGDMTFPVSSKTMSQVFDPVFAFEMWGRFGADWRTNPGSFSKQLAGFFASPRPSIAAYEDGLAALKDYQTAVDRLFDSVDVIITPTVPVTAPLIAGPIDGLKILRNTWPFNAAGTPAISIPARSAGRAEAQRAKADHTGLPVGVQLIARRGNDDHLLRLARTIIAP